MAAWIKNRLKPTFVNITYWLMIYCTLNFTVFQFIPIYFIDQDNREIYYLTVYFLLVVASIFQLLTAITGLNIIWKMLSFICLLLGLFILFLFIIFGFLMLVWTEAGTLYTQKHNPEVRIIRRYLDAGALGGGTSPDDFEIVLHRPLTPIFKLETSIDTLIIDKNEWKKNK